VIRFRGLSPRAGSASAAVLVLPVLLVAGCGDPDTSPVPNTLPTTTTSAGGSPPPAGGTWTGLTTKCPTLTGLGARMINATGEGRPTAEYRTDGPLVTADCEWGSTDGKGVLVRMRMTIYPAGPAADAAWRVLSAGQTEKISKVGDEAFLATEPPEVVTRARSRNVTAIVRLVVPAGSATPDRLHNLRPVSAEITAEVLDDLR
jgi:hypothetical protein